MKDAAPRKVLNNLFKHTALKMAYNAIDQGAADVDMGRNIFQSDSPVGMMKAIKAIVHGRETHEKAYDLYQTIKNKKK